MSAYQCFMKLNFYFLALVNSYGISMTKRIPLDDLANCQVATVQYSKYSLDRWESHISVTYVYLFSHTPGGREREGGREGKEREGREKKILSSWNYLYVNMVFWGFMNSL